jgi:hypothetical protein
LVPRGFIDGGAGLDAAPDRLLHGAHHLKWAGDSRPKQRSAKARLDAATTG